MSERTLEAVTIHAPRRRGRPRCEETTVPVSTRLPIRELDVLIKYAAQHRMSVAEVARALLLLGLREWD